MKVFLGRKDQAVLSSIILYFFGLGRHKFTKKVNPGVFLSFSDSLKLKNAEFLLYWTR